MMKYRLFAPFHNRFEDGVHKAKDENSRIVELEFSPDEKEISVVITPSLTLKRGNFDTVQNFPDGATCTNYEGQDPDYLFSVIRKGNTFVQFIVSRIDMNVSIVYPIQSVM